MSSSVSVDNVFRLIKKHMQHNGGLKAQVDIVPLVIVTHMTRFFKMLCIICVVMFYRMKEESILVMHLLFWC